ncbi:hypothetical protein CHS0354_004735 [Potamilus streckersoni]|uniref:SAM domain-containing protein n=1 Tax=Potamilus streckersoni TaxID=2493646 RepID=A0AAE0TCZ5_9BIVA|nr:hypothetical protein CHS0354_004735 [Potamilus streckersoni]
MQHQDGSDPTKHLQNFQQSSLTSVQASGHHGHIPIAPLLSSMGCRPVLTVPQAFRGITASGSPYSIIRQPVSVTTQHQGQSAVLRPGTPSMVQRVSGTSQSNLLTPATGSFPVQSIQAVETGRTEINSPGLNSGGTVRQLSVINSMQPQLGNQGMQGIQIQNLGSLHIPSSSAIGPAVVGLVRSPIMANSPQQSAASPRSMVSTTLAVANGHLSPRQQLVSPRGQALGTMFNHATLQQVNTGQVIGQVISAGSMQGAQFLTSEGALSPLPPVAVPISPGIYQVSGQAHAFSPPGGILQPVFISGTTSPASSTPQLIHASIPFSASQGQATLSTLEIQNPSSPMILSHTPPQCISPYGNPNSEMIGSPMLALSPAMPTLLSPTGFVDLNAPEEPTDLSKKSDPQSQNSSHHFAIPEKTNITDKLWSNSHSDSEKEFSQQEYEPYNFQEKILNLKVNTRAAEDRKRLSYSQVSCPVLAVNEKGDNYGSSSNFCKMEPPHTDSNEVTGSDGPGGEVSVEGEVSEEDEFIWEDYLQKTGARAVPPTAFKHVEYSLQSGFVKGMKLEVPNKCNAGTYWVATVLMTCGPLLRLRYDGYEDDSSADFWCDLGTSEVHSIGWCAQNGQNLQPPEAIKYKYSDWREFLMSALTGARTAPSYLLDKTTGITPVDQLKQGMRLEIQHRLNPREVWLTEIIENVGGRLYLRLEGGQSGASDFWMFYLNIRLHPIGWARTKGYEYKPPQEIKEQHTDQEWEEILQKALEESEEKILPIDVFKDQEEVPTHQFECGWKLEALNPDGLNQVCPATIVKVIDNQYFIIEIDDLRADKPEPVQYCCHANIRGLFPIQWSQSKGIRLTTPKGWDRPEFNWTEYLTYCGAKAAPEKCFNLDFPDHEFERGLKLEAVNPENPNQICAATLTKIVGPLLWIHLDNSTKVVASHIEHVESHNLFPVGWCESNVYQLKPPRKSGFHHLNPNRVAVVHPEMARNAEEFRSETYSHVKNGLAGGYWCPKLYFNHRCFSGPYLSKGRISELPKCVGPGPINLVLQEVLSMLVSVAYKSCRVLKELQLEGSPNPRMLQTTLKAKYRGKSYCATVEMCHTADQVEEFCRQVCIKLDACPYLFSPHFIEGECPENCQQLTKTKYNYYYGKKIKKVGRPPGSRSGLPPKFMKPPGKRGRKRKRFHLIHKKTHPSLQASISQTKQEDDKCSESSDTKTNDSWRSTESKEKMENGDVSLKIGVKRKYTHHLPPPSDIKTRGAKLPKYSFERKTHKKVLIPNSPPPQERLKLKSLERKVSSTPSEVPLTNKEEPLHLDSNPLYWPVEEVTRFIKRTDCAQLARVLKEQEIDGQALLLLTLPAVQEYLELKLGPAVKLCHQIERLKIAFFENYAQ